MNLDLKIQLKGLPESWEVAMIGDILLTNSGGTPSTTIKEYWQNGTIPWINSGALKDGVIRDPTTHITEAGLSNSSAKLFPVRTIVIALTGSTTGKVGILDINCATNQSVVGIYPSKYLEPKFLFYYLIAIRSQIISQAIGSAQPHINKGVIDGIEIPIAPKEHQKKIVSILDDIIIKIENISAQVKEIEKLEGEVLKSYLYDIDELFNGVKIGNYCKERKDRIGKNWKNKRLIGVSKDVGIIDLRVSDKLTFENYKIVKPGDFIYNPMRVDIGSIAIWEGEELVLTSPDYIVFSIEHTISSLLLLKFLKSGMGLAQINNNTKGSVRSRLYFKNLSEIVFPLKDLDHQIEAQTILEGFKNARNEITYLQSNLNNIIYDTFQRVFKGDFVNYIKFEGDGKQISALMKLEKEEIVLQSKNNVKKKPLNMQKAKNKINVLEFVKKIFGIERFTFDQLFNKTGMDYETLKNDLYNIIDKDIAMEFDVTSETMYLKLK